MVGSTVMSDADIDETIEKPAGHSGHSLKKRRIWVSEYRNEVIEGDGIGKEVVPEGIKVLEAVGRVFDITFEWQHFPWSCETWHTTGKMMPDDGIDQLRDFDAIFLGAVGYPGVPDHISLWGLLIPIRRAFDQYVNLRPCTLMEEIGRASCRERV